MTSCIGLTLQLTIRIVFVMTLVVSIDVDATSDY